MREDLARDQARADRPTGPNFTILYIGVGFLTMALAAYVLTVVFTGVPEWIAPDVLSAALIRDIVTRPQTWVLGLIGAWAGYKVASLPDTQIR